MTSPKYPREGHSQPREREVIPGEGGSKGRGETVDLRTYCEDCGSELFTCGPVSICTNWMCRLRVTQSSASVVEHKEPSTGRGAVE